MAGRVARMSRAVDGMAGTVTADARNLGGMQTTLEHMGKDGEAALQYYDQLQGDLDTASRQYKIINSPCGNRTRWLTLPPTRPVISKNKRLSPVAKDACPEQGN